MSTYFNYDTPDFAQLFDKSLLAMGTNVIAGLLRVHCGAPLKDLHVLDAGCGTGTYAKDLLQFGIGRLSLLDASSEMLQIARDKLEDKSEKKKVNNVIHACLPNIPFKDATFDAVMFNFVFHHLVNTKSGADFSTVETTLINAKKVLRPKGVLVITTMLPSVFRKAVWYSKLCPSIIDRYFKPFLTTEVMLELITKCGFKCVSAVNFLRTTQSTGILNYRDPEGPLKEEWRQGTCVFSLADDHEIQEMQQYVLSLKEKGQLTQFMQEQDHTSEIGSDTCFVCISV